MIQVIVMLSLAVLFVWRGNTFSDVGTASTSLVPAVMCAAFATFLVLTAVALAFGRDENGEMA